MKKEQLFLSTIDQNAGKTARKYGLGLEIADFCTAMNMDTLLEDIHPGVEQQVQGISNRLFHGPFNELFPCAIDPMARELAKQRFFQAGALAEHYGARKIIFHGGYLPNVYFPCWYIQQSVSFWKELLQLLPGLELCVENVLESDPQWMEDLASGVDDPRFRLCLDVGHCNVYSQIPVEAWLQKLAPWIGHFHIHNNDRSFDTHSPLGEGSIPMNEFLTCAQQLCPEATFTLEVTDGERAVRYLAAQKQLEELP